MKEYQKNFSSLHREVYFDSANRALKAKKMLAILRDYSDRDLKQLHVLDIGCSTGSMSNYLSNHFGRVTGIDIDEKAIEHAQSSYGSGSLLFRVGDAMATGLEPESVDIVICAHVYEHVPCPQLMMDEIFRVLRPGGVCYFAAENRIVFREGDYRLPFLSLMPKPMGHLYLRLAGRGDHYYETLLTVWQLRRLVSRFGVVDYTRRVVLDPVRFCAREALPPGSFTQLMALAVLRCAYWAFPTYLWLLRKP